MAKFPIAELDFSCFVPLLFVAGSFVWAYVAVRKSCDKL